MKEIKRTRTVEEVTGYEAFDGEMFKTKEECNEYENTAYAVIRKRLNALAVSIDGGIHNTFSECEIYESYGYGSEEYEYMIVDIKNEEDLRVVNQYYELVRKTSGCKENLASQLQVPDKYIGKRVMISIGFSYDRSITASPKTMDELVEQFKKDIGNFFYPEKVAEEKKGEECVQDKVL